ncbi:MAG: TetR/AcrR family transcriptional regulator [Myxococcota bacterium]
MGQTRERLIDSATRRFYRDGFRDVGIDQVMDDVGISKTAFYKHFRSKDELMLAVLEKQNRWLQGTFRELVEQRAGSGASAADQLRALMEVVKQIIEDDEFQGCIFVNVAMEFPLLHQPAHRAAAEHKRAIEAFVEDLASRSGAADPRALAQDLCLVMEGAYVTRQVTGDATTIAVARRVAAAVIESHLGA